MKYRIVKIASSETFVVEREARKGWINAFPHIGDPDYSFSEFASLDQAKKALERHYLNKDEVIWEQGGIMSKDMQPHYVVTRSQMWHSFWYGVIFGASIFAAGVLLWRYV